MPQLKKELLDYLNKLIKEVFYLPGYYPPEFAFDKVRVYVQVSQELLKLRQQEAEERERRRRAGEIIPENEGKRVYDPLRTEERYKETIEARILSWDKDVRNKIHRGVILGDPGFGKTWLLKYEALQSAREAIDLINKKVKIEEVQVPIFFRLQDLAGQDKRIDEAILALLTERYYLSCECTGLIKEKMKNGTCLLLLDALDEVSDRAVLSERLSAFAQNSPCKILLTSRIAGYKEPPFRLSRNERERELELIAFNEAQVKTFISTWFKKDATKKDKLISNLSSTTQLRGISRIPLLLSFICYLYSEREELPENRLGFYKECIDDFLLEKWKAPPREQTQGYIDEKRRLLEYLAYRLFIEGKEQFSTTDLMDTIEPYLEKLGSSNPLSGIKSDKLVDELSEADGILIKVATVGDNLPYIFLHLTFQEYLTACYIVGQASCLSFLEPVLFNPRFREVVRLTAGMLPKDERLKPELRDERLKPELRKTDGINSLEFQSLGFQPTVWNFIKFILKQKPLCYDVLHQPLLLAGLCIADIPDKNANPSLERKILDKLWELWSKTEFNPLREEINRVFTAMAGSRNSEKIINNLLERLEDKDSQVRKNAVKALGKLGRADDRMIDGLLGRLEDKDFWVRGNAAEALGKLGQADDRVIDKLLGRLENENWWGCGDAVSVLGELGCADDKVIDALLGRLEDGWVRWDAASALGKLGRADDRVIEALLGRLEDKDSWVRKYAAEALGKLDRTDDRVIDRLLGRLEDKGGYVRSDASKALGKLGRADDRVIEALLGRLEDKDSWVRKYAAEALGKLDRTDDRVIDRLLGRLEDENPLVRKYAASALGELGRTDKKVIDGLLGLLEDKNKSVRRSTTEALGKLGRADDRMIDGLLGRLENKEVWVRSNAASALGKLGRADNRVINGLLKLLEDKVSDVRDTAYSSLQKLAEKQARERMVLPASYKFELTPVVSKAIENLDFKLLKDTFYSLFASIPYEWYTKNELYKYEGHYASMCYAVFASLGYDLAVEESTNRGRIDMVIKTDKAVIIFEFKEVAPLAVVEEESDKNTALEQIKDRKYYEKYLNSGKGIYLVGIEFSKTERNITKFDWEKAGYKNVTLSGFN